MIDDRHDNDQVLSMSNVATGMVDRHAPHPAAGAAGYG
jgi:hypothetical protein